MQNLRLTNPYKLDESNPPLVHLQGDVSQEVWNRIYLLHPYKGIQDKIISSLFHKFAEQVEKEFANEPNTTSESNEQRLAAIIQRCSFTPASGEGHNADE